jgi:hypothetical protein
VYTLRVQAFVRRKPEQGFQEFAAGFRRTGPASDAKTIAAARDFDAEPAFDLPKVFVELTAQVGEAVVVGGFEDDFP